jgi:hypothetical protein
MRFLNLINVARIGFIVLVLAFASAGTTVAQSGGANDRSGSATRTADRDDDTDWGWLGLLGLAGLLGLMPKRRAVDVRDTQTTGTAHR